MSFDKVQAMRNAERHVSLGKIRSAIEEYILVVEHDPKDMGTLNMLGDLFAKDSNKPQAIACYKKVAEFYGKQGYSQKAIAVYKKIAKLDPDSVEISGKLAELYQTKGSVSEARSHFSTLADHYQKQGHKTEALAIWKQISILDQNDTEVLVKAAEVYLGQDQPLEAADAYTEVGTRLCRIGRYDSAAEIFTNAITIQPSHIAALSGFVKAKTKLGQAVEAAKTLEEILEKEPYNQEIYALSIECFLGADDLPNAEKRVIRLVEQEPSTYPKLVELVEIYLSKQDPAGASRCLTLAMEHLLIGGQGEEAGKWIDSILEAESEQLGALKLKVRYFSWQRDDKGLCDSLKKLDETAVKKGSLEDERYALSQLVMLLPEEMSYADRLREINEKHGFTDNLYDEVILKGQFEDQADLYADELATGFDFAIDDKSTIDHVAQASEEIDLIERNGAAAVDAASSNGFDKKALEEEIETFAAIGSTDEEAAPGEDFGVADDDAIAKELESVKFYVDSGYSDLAETALNELSASYGERPEIEALRAALGQKVVPETSADEVPAPKKKPAKKQKAKKVAEEAAPPPAAKKLDLDEIRIEFGVDEADAVLDGNDYDTHYQMGVAYQEMGLMEDAIKEFQDAIGQIGENDKSRRFFQCAHLLGHCFMQKGMAKLALKWFNRALEIPGLNADEKKGIWYELAEAHEVDGDSDNAARYFEQVYAEDVDYRDVGNRLQNLTVNA